MTLEGAGSRHGGDRDSGTKLQMGSDNVKTETQQRCWDTTQVRNKSLSANERRITLLLNALLSHLSVLYLGSSMSHKELYAECLLFGGRRV